ETHGRFSPDGNWIAYVSDDTGRREIYVKPFPDPAARVQVSIDGGSYAEWSPDGERLYFRADAVSGGAPGDGASGGTRMMVAEFEKAGEYSNPQPRLLFETPETFWHFQVAPDDERFLLHLLPSDTAPGQVILNGLPHHAE
ncbi:MAG: hypothetical protein GWO24_02655, partial [Akkermansiaceae bacterium]|nr:hypothetical protein [Akkermansiaceae bacterium]